MSERIEELIMLLSLIVVLGFIGWVFYITRNPLSFLLIFVLPILHRKSDDKEVTLNEKD